MSLVDSYNRVIDYLRISVTDRCNFRCVYCMPEEGAPIAASSDLLRADEIVRVVSIASALGMSKIRVTGGEPLVRKDILDIVSRLAKIPTVRELSMTTNGFLLQPIAQLLARSGLSRINISLDTLRPDRFVTLARRGNLDVTIAGIDAAIEAGLTPVKLNCVVMRGWNDDEVVDFAYQTIERNIDVRFIELMPINWSSGDDSPVAQLHFARSGTAHHADKTTNMVTLYANTELATFRQSFHGVSHGEQKGQLDALAMRRAFISSDEIRKSIEAHFGTLQPASVTTNGPARTYRIPGALGTIGFISQITNDMCVNCNRLRLTADGQLRPCLMADGEVDLRTLLRSGASDADIEDRIRITVLHKPKEHRLDDGLAPTGRNMSQLGG